MVTIEKKKKKAGRPKSRPLKSPFVKQTPAPSNTSTSSTAVTPASSIPATPTSISVESTLTYCSLMPGTPIPTMATPTSPTLNGTIFATPIPTPLPTSPVMPTPTNYVPSTPSTLNPTTIPSTPSTTPTTSQPSSERSSANPTTLKEYGKELYETLQAIGKVADEDVDSCLAHFLALSYKGRQIITNTLEITLLSRRMMRRLMKLLKSIMPSKNASLFLLDESLISDAQWNVLRSGHNLKSAMLEKTTLWKTRRAWNSQVQDDFGIGQEDDGTVVYLDVQKLIRYILLEDELLYGKPISTPSRQFKLSVDVGQGELVMTITPMWSRPHRSMQSPKSTYLIGAYPCTQEDCEKILKSFKKPLKNIQSCETSFRNDGIDVTFKHVSDLKAYWALVSLPKNEWCPYCHKLKQHPVEKKCGDNCTGDAKSCCYSRFSDKSAPLRTVDVVDVFGLSQKKYGICSMHATQRSMERMINVGASKFTVDNMESCLQQLPGFHTFKFRPKSNDTIEDSSQEILECPMLSIDQCMTLLSERNKWLAKLEKPGQSSGYSEMIHIFAMVVFKILLANSSEFKATSLKEKRQMIDLWIQQYTSITGMAPTYYMHILYDHLKLLSEILLPSLTAWNNQGVENYHKWKNTLKKRDTNNGGGLKNANGHQTTLILTPTTQVMLRQCRLLALRVFCLQSEDDADKQVIKDWQVREVREMLSAHKRYSKKLEEKKEASCDEEFYSRLLEKYEQYLGNVEEDGELDGEECDEQDDGDYDPLWVDEEEEQEEEEEEEVCEEEDLDEFLNESEIFQDEESDDERPWKRRRNK